MKSIKRMSRHLVRTLDVNYLYLQSSYRRPDETVETQRSYPYYNTPLEDLWDQITSGISPLDYYKDSDLSREEIIEHMEYVLSLDGVMSMETRVEILHAILVYGKNHYITLNNTDLRQLKEFVRCMKPDSGKKVIYDEITSMIIDELKRRKNDPDSIFHIIISNYSKSSLLLERFFHEFHRPEDIQELSYEILYQFFFKAVNSNQKEVAVLFKQFYLKGQQNDFKKLEGALKTFISTKPEYAYVIAEIDSCHFERIITDIELREKYQTEKARLEAALQEDRLEATLQEVKQIEDAISDTGGIFDKTNPRKTVRRANEALAPNEGGIFGKTTPRLTVTRANQTLTTKNEATAIHTVETAKQTTLSEKSDESLAAQFSKIAIPRTKVIVREAHTPIQKQKLKLD